MTTQQPTDLRAALIEEIAAPIAAHLAAHGIDEPPPLAPPTREGAGDLALPCHKYARVFRKAPQMIAADLAEVATAHPLVSAADPVAGFLNLHFDWTAVAARTLAWARTDIGALGRNTALAGQTLAVEFSSPNSNKPQHLGHCRNNILGETVARLADAAGADVVRINLINDRGIAICKTMVAYEAFGEGRTPADLGVKGDHYIGDLYVRFEKAWAAEYESWKAAHADEDVGRDEFFNTRSDWGRKARDLLLRWEAGDADARSLWETLNSWCIGGFEQTYARMGVSFDRIDLESRTYLLGKDIVEDGLERGVFHRLDDGAVVFDLERIGLEGEKVVLRSDGTSVYMTQDLGTAAMRADEIGFDRMVYVVGNEQDHHFNVLFGIMGALRPALEGKLQHLSYGMIELPEGKMKSREGKVVDADDLMDGLHEAAAEATRAGAPDLGDEALAERAEAIALGGLKFFLLKYAPQTNFVFDPARSLDFQGETGPYCMYAYARASSILRKLGSRPEAAPDFGALTLDVERAVMSAMLAFPHEIATAALELKPSLLTRATFELAKAFATFFNHPEARVIGAEPAVQAARIELVEGARRMLGAGLDLMGITALEEM
jgi:arginyl-tRNA synthetase